MDSGLPDRHCDFLLPGDEVTEMLKKTVLT